MSGGGSQTTTSSTTVPPQFLNAYQNTVSRAQNVASNPYQAYTGNLVAGFTPQQTQAQSQVSALQGQYQPELNAAQSSINASTTPLWSETMQSGVAPGAGIAGYTPNFTANNPGVNASTIAQYENPFQSQVIGSTEAEIANTDAQQQAQLSGNAASAGAFGGDRMGVAQGILGGQQALANNSTLAGLNTTNYDTALQTAEQQQATGIAAQEAATQMGYQEFNTEQGAQLGANEANAWLNSQAGYADANLANEGNQLGLTDASALAQSGLTQQQQAQAGLNTAYEQWQAQQAFPYQQTGWLANITEGIGSNVGGSSTTSTSQNNRGGRIHRWGGGIIPASYDNGGGISILGDTPDPANSYIPSASGGGGSMGRGPPSPGGAPPMQQNPLSNPATDIGALNGALSLYNNLGIGSMLSPATTTTLPSTTIGGIATGTPAIGNAAASAGPGFLGNVANTVATGASDAASAIGSGVGAAADAVGNGLAAGAGAIGSGLGWLGDLFLSIFAKDGGRIGAEEPQHHAGGGIVIPFPQDRMHRASGGIAAGNYGEMPYSMAPPVPLQATGTTGMAPMSFAQPGASPMSPSGGGIGSAHGAPMPYGGSTAFRRGGIVPHFDDGGTTPDAPAANDDDWSGAGDTPSAADTANWNAPAIASQSSGIASSGPTYTAEKPNLWMPAVAGIASAVLGRHTNNARNVAEGVLAGLNTYQGEDQRYQQGQEKAVSLDQEAKRLADDAMFHKEQLANEATKTQQEGDYQKGLLANDTTKTSNEAKYQSGLLANDTAKTGIEGARVGIEADAEKSLAAWRDKQGSATTPIGTNPATGGLLFASKYGSGMMDETGQPYTGPVGAMPSVAAHVAATTRGQDLAHGDRVARLDQGAQQFSDRLAQTYGEGARKATDSIYLANKDPLTGKPNLTYQQAQGIANKSMPGFFTGRQSAGASAQPQSPPGIPTMTNPSNPPAAAAPAAPSIPTTLPQGLPPGSQYSPSRQQWRDPTGKMYDASGNPLGGS